MQYVYLFGGMIAGFISGYFFHAPVECPQVNDDECDKGVVDRAYDRAVKNCVDKEDWTDYECFRYMNTGRSPATPTPRPTPSSVPKYKPYYGTDEDTND